MRILVLGGSGFVGRAVAELGVARGDDVTVFNRGLRSPVAGVRVLAGDRTATGGLGALRDGTWDTVVDTWSAGAEVVGAAAELLKGRAGHFSYVSSRSVYHYDENAAAVPRLNEDAPLVAGDEPGYAGDKLRGERAAEAFGGPLLLARAGLILGPHEDIGRLPWWLGRLHRGGPTLAPGPYDLPLQYVDARDLAAFLLDAAAAGTTGPFNVVSEPGHTTMGELLEVAGQVTGGHADLRWTAPETILAAGIEPWIQLPCWLPPGPLHTFLHDGDVRRAFAAGLRCRPVHETVTDTWAWLQSLPGGAPQRADRPVVGLDPKIEADVLGL
ncbi:reductase [Actinoplanes italicus]|uniref:Nucleoside-diphosphate-sugar epimerase n=1 Tax=Actinoplanes italicus TaxID=113567 RepID=A0A2T0KGT3_9ACTN|nr:NAD-dependent epimerase/dehydratase family protein [Actinoplanes italicus]PRX22649.1 nucleoside-diphosphate-sugar epimerase [Actinoplanes italicus]GIE28169.1 reductase [Actinoplanes italicus]